MCFRLRKKTTCQLYEHHSSVDVLLRYIKKRFRGSTGTIHASFFFFFTFDFFCTRRFIHLAFLNVYVLYSMHIIYIIYIYIYSGMPLSGGRGFFLALSAAGQARGPWVHYDAGLDPGRAPWRCSVQ